MWLTFEVTQNCHLCAGQAATVTTHQLAVPYQKHLGNASLGSDFRT